ncbi:MAG: DUF3788 domain-containing protein [Propionibacteriaceae bacterium]|nr:DUF3788 domain-containing protein [Propionibacteriaceae bacterium]
MDAVFADPAVEPTPESITEALGSSSEAWHSLGDMLAEAGVSVEQRYYRDGGWLSKATKGSKTMTWMRVDRGFGWATFYFPDRHRETLENATDLPSAVRQQIKERQSMGKTLGVTLEVRTSKEVETAKALLAYKLSLK